MSSVITPFKSQTFLPKRISDSRVPAGHAGSVNKPTVQPEAQLFSESDPGANAPI